MPEGLAPAIVLLITVVFIIVGTAKLKLHPFVVLLLACYLAGLASGLPVEDIAIIISRGFGDIMAYIGIVIVLGTIIGVILEKSFAAVKLAELVLKVTGRRYPGLALSLIGYIVSIPVFCDSAYIILSSLKKSLITRTGKSSAALSISLATGLYASHTFIPPTPGPVAAAGNMGLEDQLGLVILAGLAVAFIAMVTGYLWASFIGPKIRTAEDSETFAAPSEHDLRLPSASKSLMPIMVPVLLIALRSVASFRSRPLGTGFIFDFLSFAGHPSTALLFGFLLAFLLFPAFNHKTLTGWIGDGITAAAPILLITGAGGAFGTVLKEAQAGETLGNLLSDYHMGILLPFIVAAAFKTAQGSSTVAMIAASALVAPLLPVIGLDSQTGRVFAVMAAGAGAMTVSHANDSFFWVVTQFSGMDVKTGLKTLTTASLIQGVSAMVFIYLLTLMFLR